MEYPMKYLALLFVVIAIIVNNSAIAAVASWYGPGFHGRLTANGERYNMYALTAAHKTLPFGTEVKVTNMKNGKAVVVRINDRGPYTKGRIIDLSKAAHLAIDCNLCKVELDIIKQGDGQTYHQKRTYKVSKKVTKRKYNRTAKVYKRK